MAIDRSADGSRAPFSAMFGPFAHITVRLRAEHPDDARLS